MQSKSPASWVRGQSWFLLRTVLSFAWVCQWSGQSQRTWLHWRISTVCRAESHYPSLYSHTTCRARSAKVFCFELRQCLSEPPQLNQRCPYFRLFRLGRSPELCQCLVPQHFLAGQLFMGALQWAHQALSFKYQFWTPVQPCAFLVLHGKGSSCHRCQSY
jgi:hypothetical protein